MQSAQRENGLHGEPYLGVHLRRNDWVWAHGDTMPTVEASVQAVARVARDANAGTGAGELKIKTVFLATDANATDAAALHRAFAGAGLRVVRYLPIPKNKFEKQWFPGFPGVMAGSLLKFDEAASELQMPAVDQLLCARAAVFIGTLGSGFSQQMHLERRRWHARQRAAGRVSPGSPMGVSYMMGGGGQTAGHGSVREIPVEKDRGHY